jgi:outer membrane lipoprotein-sorting protein
MSFERPLALTLVVAALVAGPLAVAQQAEQSLPAVVRKAIAEFPKLRYTGTRTVEFKVGADRQRHTEQVIRSGPNVRVEFPRGSEFFGQVIVEDGKRRLHYFPDKNEVHVLPPRKEEAFFRFLQNRPRGQGRGPSISSQTGGRVAGRATELVTVNDPRGNPIQRLWIDPATGLVLRRETLDRSGSRLAFFEFTRINYRPNIDPRDFQITAKARVVRPEDLVRRLANQHGMVAVFLNDPGYQLEGGRIMRLGDDPVLLQTYVGNARLSLFQVRQGIDTSRLSGPRGSFQTFAWQSHGRTFVLVGEAEQAELRRLAAKLSDE